jgi:hypothetical protein
MQFPFINDSHKVRTALLVGISSGLISILVDTDHVIAYLWQINYGRFLHPLAFIAACIIAICNISYFRRLHNKAILKL